MSGRGRRVTEPAMDATRFNELMDSLNEAVAYHRGAKLDLRVTTLPEPPRPMSPDAVKQLRSAVKLSQALFAAHLNVSTKLVQAWEGGRRVADGAALVLLRLAQQNPGSVFPTGFTPIGGGQAPGHRPATSVRPPPRAGARRAAHEAPTKQARRRGSARSA
jgi:putative transcriptional regulator